MDKLKTIHTYTLKQRLKHNRRGSNKQEEKRNSLKCSVFLFFFKSHLHQVAFNYLDSFSFICKVLANAFLGFLLSGLEADNFERDISYKK